MNTQTTTDATEEKPRIPWPFHQRWRISGCLIAESPLFIGSGNTSHRDHLKNDDELVEIADCLRGANDWPALPATSLKGVLRAWLGREEEEQIKRLFGEDSKENNSGRGGEVEFLDAHLTLPRNSDTPLPHWDQDKQTWVEIINSIDRERGVAAENHLAHRETVAAGSGFELEITGQFSQPQNDIPLLLAALEGFNDPENPVLLGADTISGKGRMHWELAVVERLDATSVLEWLEDPNRGMAQQAFQPLPTEELATLKESATVYTGMEEKVWNFPLTLHFNGPFLVNNPSTDEEMDVPQDQKPAHARPRTNEMGQVILPAKSLRGVLRSQGEKILRTLLDMEDEQWINSELQQFVERRIACRPEIPTRACNPLKGKEEAGEKLCLACQLFGAPGWRSPMAITDFTLKPGDYERQTQEMLAVDRFTGGGKDKAKYNAQAIIDPVLEGRVKLDKRRAPGWGLGLLALLLRDLKEGELRFGWGAAGKGYGHCTAEIDKWDDHALRQDAQAAWGELIKLIKEHIDTLKENLPHTEDEQATKPEASGHE
ncbi:hypothetical protein DJ031_15345 [bacterium endosymbiont of Escarpia laminata]|nr:MAG: hypothetical protein DJ031_15345 [bacterium endosymbiont of Escarpia laminata]